MTITPSYQPNITSAAKQGTIVGAITMTMSDGSAFAGTYTVAAQVAPNFLTTAGNNLVLGRDLTTADTADYGVYRVTAQQNVVQLNSDLNGFNLPIFS